MKTQTIYQPSYRTNADLTAWIHATMLRIKKQIHQWRTDEGIPQEYTVSISELRDDVDYLTNQIKQYYPR